MVRISGICSECSTISPLTLLGQHLCCYEMKRHGKIKKSSRNPAGGFTLKPVADQLCGMESCHLWDNIDEISAFPSSIQSVVGAMDGEFRPVFFCRVIKTNFPNEQEHHGRMEIALNIQRSAGWRGLGTGVIMQQKTSPALQECVL